jgi:Peptidase family M23
MKNRWPALLILLAISLQVFGQTSEQGVAKGHEGVWQGTLEEGGSQLRLVLTITKSASGGYSGKVDSLDQCSTIPIDMITVTGDAVRLELKSVGAVYEGELNKDRSEMSGKLTQGGASIPLVFKAGAPSQSSAATKPPPAPSQRQLSVPFDVAVPVAPTAFKAGGKTHLVYELHATNFSRRNCALTRLEVIGAGEKPYSRAVPIAPETVGGNYVTLDLGQGRYTFYAHLQPGSLRVKAGDKVRRGQVVGLVGNSGASTEPHLHFHISDANSPLGSDGLPYLLPAFEAQGKGWGWKASEAKATTEKRQMEIPLENDVVRFPDAP